MNTFFMRANLDCRLRRLSKSAFGASGTLRSAALLLCCMLATVRAWSDNCTPPPAGLVSWWAAEGNAADSFGGNNGILVGGVTFTNGEVRQAFALNGTSQYVDVPNSASLNPTARITCEAWVYLEQYPASVTSPVIKKAGEGLAAQHGYSLEISSGGVNFGVYVGGAWANDADTVPLTLNQWTHLAGVYDGTNVSLYVNGNLAALLHAPGSITSSGNDLHIGHDASNPNRYLNGLIDEASVYNTALSAAQVQAIYNAGTAGKCGAPPMISGQPRALTVFQGNTASLSVNASGTQPLSYQWLENTTNIPAAVNPSAVTATLSLTNVQVAQSGNIYSVMVSNLAGNTNSSNAMLTVLPPGSCFPPPPGLVSWWAGENNGLDNLGANNGTLVGGVGFTNGVVGDAFVFNGTNIVQIPDAPDLNYTGNSPLTVELWAYRTGTQTPMHIIGKKNPGCGTIEYQMGWDANNGGLSFGGNVDAAFTHSTLPLNAWTHLVGTFDGTTFLFYTNGVLAGSGTGTLGPAVSAPLTIGDAGGCPGFVGFVDEVAIYNRALSAGEIQAIYTAGSAGKCPPAPVITGQPNNVTAFEGYATSFSVNAGGGQPLSYQWQENSTNIPAAINPTATNAMLVLTNLQIAQEGFTYSVVVSNVAGNTNSSNAVLTVLSTGSCFPPPPGLVSWWPGEHSGIDIIGTNNGTLIGGVNFASGEVDEAFNLNGTSQYVDVPNSPSLNPAGSITCEAWVYLRQYPASSTSPVIKKAGEGSVPQDGYSLEIAAGGANFGVYVNGAWANNNDSIPVPLNQWTHVAGVYDGTNNFLYVNGQLASSVHAPGTISPSGNDLQIGHDPSDATRYFNGLIDEATVYNTALTAAQIQAIYDAGSVGKCKAPLIALQPQSQLGYWGNNVTFSVNVAGSGALSYQWELNDVAITNATNATLILSSLQFTNAGAYSVIISNAYGSVTSAPAFLTVNPAGVSIALYPGITIAGTPGYTYGIQYNLDLSNTNSWLGLTNLTLSDSNALWYDSVPAAQPQRYYRVVPGPISIP
jgi:hypothetical protein